MGKTSLLSRYIDGIFPENYNATIGANFLIKEIDLKNIIERIREIRPELKEDIRHKGFKLFYWDIGGQSDKLFVNEYYFLQAVGAVVVFDITLKETFENLDFWVEKLKEQCGDIPFLIVGNKADKEEEREVSFEDAKKKAESYGREYIETSAKLNENVDKVFETLAIKILNNLKVKVI